MTRRGPRRRSRSLWAGAPDLTSRTDPGACPDGALRQPGRSVRAVRRHDFQHLAPCTTRGEALVPPRPPATFPDPARRYFVPNRREIRGGVSARVRQSSAGTSAATRVSRFVSIPELQRRSFPWTIPIINAPSRGHESFRHASVKNRAGQRVNSRLPFRNPARPVMRSRHVFKADHAGSHHGGVALMNALFFSRP
jgi:hypothetical protein